MLMFSCMMYEKRGLPFLFRVYRCTGKEGGAAEKITTTPNEEALRMMGINECVVVDMDHNGRVDGFSAHYKLLDGACIEGLTEVHREPVQAARGVASPRLPSSRPAPSRNGRVACFVTVGRLRRD